MAIQGPKSDDVVASVFGDWVRELKYFWFRESSIEGIPVVVAAQDGPNREDTRSTCWTVPRNPTLGYLQEAANLGTSVLESEPHGTHRKRIALLGGDTDEQTNPFEVRMGKYMDWIFRMR